MAELKTHWTERGVDDFLYRIASDYVRHIETLLEGKHSRATLAKKLGRTMGRISQVLNNPGNLTLKQIIRYARALGQKVSIVAYDDDDPNNLNGPIAPEIFSGCWERAGKPADFFALSRSLETSGNYYSWVIQVERGPSLFHVPQYDITPAGRRNLAGQVEETAATGKPDPFVTQEHMGVH